MTLELALEEARVRRTLPNPKARRALRLAAGISQADLGAELGVSGSAVSRWESGRRSPRRRLASAYAEVLERLRRAD